MTKTRKQSSTKQEPSITTVCLNDLRRGRDGMLREAREWKARGANDWVATYVRGAWEAHDQMMFWKREWGI